MAMAQLIITAVTVEGRTKTEVARDYGVSRYWVQQLVQRYERPRLWREGKAQFVDPIVLLGQSCRVTMTDSCCLPQRCSGGRPIHGRKKAVQQRYPHRSDCRFHCRVGWSEAGQDDPGDCHIERPLRPPTVGPVDQHCTIGAHQYIARVKITVDQASARSERHTVKASMQVS